MDKFSDTQCIQSSFVTAVIQLHGNGPWGIEYLNPEDDPRR